MARLPACVRKLRQKLSRSRQPEVGTGRHRVSGSSKSKSLATSSENQHSSTDTAPSHVKDPTKSLPLQYEDTAEAAIAPTSELLQKIQVAVSAHRELKAVEEAFAEYEWRLTTELEEMRAEGRRLVSGSRSSKDERRLDELEQTDNEIIDRLEERQVDTAARWAGMRKQIGDVLKDVDDAFQAGNPLPIAKENDAKEGRAEPNRELGTKDAPTNDGLAAADDSTCKLCRAYRRNTRTSYSDMRSVRVVSRLSRKVKTLPNLRAEVQRLEAELSQRQSLERQKFQNYARARGDVVEAQRQFDLVDLRHDYEERRFEARLAAGEDVASRLEFDLRLLLDHQRVTRNLVEAEEDLEAAKAEAVKEGIDLGDDDRSSGFVSLVSDGYCESKVEDLALQHDSELIQKWTVRIPAGSGPDETENRPEADEWDARSVEIWDSVSCYAHDSYRRRIDWWQDHRREGLASI